LKKNIEVHYTTIEALSINTNNQLDVKSHEIINCDKKLEVKKAVLNNAEYFSKIFIRKDPPFDSCYLNLSYLLEHTKKLKIRIINNPNSIRNHNEKLSILNFKDIIPPTIVTTQKNKILDFLEKQKKIILKPLDGMAGNGIFMLALGDKNLNVIIETMTENGRKLIMVQKYLSEIKNGDKRIIVIKGKALPFSLARIPSEEDFRANLAKGGKGIAQKLTNNDIKIVSQVHDYLIKNELDIVGLDVIGNFLTEINITSPTGIVEITEQTNFDAAEHIINVL
jgi:glutathione synthase